MSQVKCVVVDSVNNISSHFVKSEVTFGRNQSNDIDIPNPVVSRRQCVLKWVENEWFLCDLSSQKSTLINGIRLDGFEMPLRNGDKISFLHCPAEFQFYGSYEEVPSKFKKRKIDESESTRCSVPCKIFKSSNTAELPESPVKSQKEVDHSEELAAKDLVIDSLNLELEALNTCCRDLRSELDAIKSRNQELESKLEESSSSVNKLKSDMEEVEKEKNVFRMECQILSKKLNELTEAKEKMIMEMQTLIEDLKDCEEEKNRLLEESRQPVNQLIVPKEEGKEEVEASVISSVFSMESKGTDEAETSVKDDEKSVSKDDEDYFSASALNKIVDLVEAKYNEKEMELLQVELREKDDKITEITLEFEKRRQELLDTIDKELLCSICSNMIYDAVALNCRHTFCRACLSEWKQKKKECPVCRTKIKVEVNPLLIDSFLDRLCDFMGGDLKTLREELKLERSKAPRPPAEVAAYTPRQRGGGRQRRGRRYPNQAHHPMINPGQMVMLNNVGMAINHAIDVVPAPNQPPAPFNNYFGYNAFQGIPNNAVVIEINDFVPAPLPRGNQVIDLTESPRRSNRQNNNH